jgi:hypothetical protein
VRQKGLAGRGRRMRRDARYLRKLSEAMDMVGEEMEKCREPSLEARTLLTDLRSYFLYLVIDTKGRKRAEELVRIFKELARTSRLHKDFFLTLAQLLSLRYELGAFWGERASRKHFEGGWPETAKILGVEDPLQKVPPAQGQDPRVLRQERHQSEGSKGFQKAGFEVEEVKKGIAEVGIRTKEEEAR